MPEEDVSRLVGETIVKWKGKDYILPTFGLRDWGLMQGDLVEEKRSRIIHAVMNLRKKFSPQEFQDLRREALQEITNVNSLTGRDLGELMGSEFGISLMLWILFERSHPGTVTREELEEFVKSDEFTEELGVRLSDQLELCLGIGKAGNSSGQTETNPAVPAEIPQEG